MNKTMLYEWDKRLQEEKTEKLLLERSLEKITEDITSQNLYLSNLTKARSIAQIVAKKTQQKIEYRIGALVTMALSAIFTEEYKFDIRFIERRNKTEVDFVLIKKGQESEDLIEAEGGGVLDVISFALRCAVWSLKKNTRNVFILDEPFKFLSRDLQSKASAMIKAVSEELKLQFIIVSHIQEVIECADKVFEIEKTKEVEKPIILKKRKQK